MKKTGFFSKGENREKLLTAAFCILSIVVFIFLWLEAMRFSWVNNEFWNEFVYQKKDNILLNIAGMAAALIAVWLVSKAADKYATHKILNIAAVIVGILCVLISIFWINISKTCPQGDQDNIVQYAVDYKNGDTSSLLKGEYVGVYRQQLGLITFMRVLFLVCGQGNYKAFQYLSALMVFVIVYAGYRIISIVTEDDLKTEAVYLVFMLFCIPMYGYTAFVYGEIISTAFVMLGAWILLSLFKNFKWWKPVLLAADCGIMIQLRRNTAIIAVAFIIVILVKIINHFDWKILSAAAAVIIGIAASQLVINGIYSRFVPEDSKEIPAVLYLAMGMHDTIEGEPGWYDDYSLATLREYDFDVDAASEDAHEEIRTFIEKCKDNPGYALKFYTLKSNIQWNVPMYQCIVMNNSFYEEPDGLAGDIYFNGKDVYLDNFMNIYQLLIYGGVVLMFVFMRKKWSGIENYVLMVGVLGGFLFSLIWEAKPRYVFPYFIMMIPYAVIGLTKLTGKMKR